MKIRPILLAGAMSVALLLPTLPAAAETPHGLNTIVNINARDADMVDLVALLAKRSGVNILIDGTATNKKVTLILNSVTVGQALKALEHSYGMTEAFDGNILHLGEPAILNKAYPTSATTQEKILPISSADPTAVANALTTILPLGTIVIADLHTNSVYIKGDPSAIAKAQDTLKLLDQPRINSNSTVGFQSAAITLNNIRASDAVTILKKELPPTGNQSLAESDHPNMVLVNGSADYVSTARAMLTSIDKPGKIVRFKVRVVDITPLNDNSNIGVLLGAPAAAPSTTGGTTTPFNPGSIAYSFLSKSVPLFATIQALKTQGHGTILAEPEISTIDNEKATLNVGEQYPITIFNPQTGQNQVQFINAGVNLTVLPTVGDDGTVTVNLDTDYSQILSFVNSYPVVGQRHVTNVMRVANDESIVIAGLFEDVTSDTIQKIPILGDLPFGLGQIFQNRVKSHTRDEIVFQITPHIVTADDIHPVSDVPIPSK